MEHKRIVSGCGPITVLVIDQHKMLVEGLKTLLTAIDGLEIIGAVSTGAEGLAVAIETNPAIVVVDATLRDMAPVVFARRLAEEGSTARVVVLSGHDDPDLVRRALNGGAVAFVLKRSSVAQLIHAVHTAAEGGFYVDPHLGHAMVSDRSGENGASTAMGRLSAREEQILRLVAWGHTGKEIAHTLGIAISSVEVTKLRAATKLALASRAQIVRYALSQGWLRDHAP